MVLIGNLSIAMFTGGYPKGLLTVFEPKNGYTSWYFLDEKNGAPDLEGGESSVALWGDLYPLVKHNYGKWP